MKRAILAVVCSLSLFAATSFAHEESIHASGGLGFHDILAPVGLRWWLVGQKVGLDVGVGFGSDPAPSAFPDEKVNHYAFDVGVPMVMRSWEGVHVLFRPGILYTSQEVAFDPPGADLFDTDNATSLSIRAEIEGEVFLRNNFSVSASHGIEFVTDQAADTTPGGPPDPDSQSSFGTIGRQLTEVGFHVYFFGGGANQ